MQQTNLYYCFPTTNINDCYMKRVSHFGFHYYMYTHTMKHPIIKETHNEIQYTLHYTIAQQLQKDIPIILAVFDIYFTIHCMFN